MRHALAIACTLALLHGLTAQAATDSCIANPDIDQIELDALAERARQGDLCSSLAVARYADSVERYMTARFYYLLAASQGDTSSDQRLLELYRQSENLVQQALYEKWLADAAERGLVEVQAELGRYLLAWKSGSQDRIGAMFWLETAAKRGHLEAQYLLSEQYSSDLVEESDLDAVGSDDLALHYARDDAKAAQWLCRAAAGGLPQAQYALAEAYSFGNIVPLDQDQNRLWLEKAAASGHPDAIAQLDDSAEPWYVRAENWGTRQLIRAEASCPDSQH